MTCGVDGCARRARGSVSLRVRCAYRRRSMKIYDDARVDGWMGFATIGNEFPRRARASHRRSRETPRGRMDPQPPTVPTTDVDAIAVTTTEDLKLK